MILALSPLTHAEPVCLEKYPDPAWTMWDPDSPHSGVRLLLSIWHLEADGPAGGLAQT